MADSDLDNAGVKAVITLGVLAFVGVVAIIVAKLVQFCMKSYYTDNEENEIDENTRDLIRARLSVIQFKKREIKKARKDKTLRVFKKWRELAQHKKKDRDATLQSQRPEESGDVVITIDKTDVLKFKENGVKENGDSKIIENGSPRRFPFFTHNKATAVGVKSHVDSLRVTSSNKTNTGQQELAVPRGRPVSSKTRSSPNVTLTDVDINATKVSVKSVHFDDNSESTKTSAENERKVKINSVAPTNKDLVSKAETNEVKNNVVKQTEGNKTSNEKT